MPGTHSDADVSYTSIANGKALDVLAHLYDGADGFVSRDKLQSEVNDNWA